MEQSGYEALMIGVYVFVFIIALTAGITLMTNILDMAEYANKTAVSGTNGTIEENENIVHERTYSGEQVLSYYRRIVDNETESKYDFKIKLSDLDTPKSLSSYIQSETINNYLNDDFKLQYIGVASGKDTYVFILNQD